MSAVSVSAQQSAQQTISVRDSSAVPQMTVVPVVKRPVVVNDMVKVDEASMKDMDRTQRRAFRVQTFANRVDSLVQSRNYVFYPNTMQNLPNGEAQLIYADYFYLGVFVDHVEVHLPIERGATRYIEILNFDTMSIKNYRASREQSGWSVTFNLTNDELAYVVDLSISNVTGESVLTLLTPTTSMKYVGYMWRQR